MVLRLNGRIHTGLGNMCNSFDGVSATGFCPQRLLFSYEEQDLIERGCGAFWHGLGARLVNSGNS